MCRQDRDHHRRGDRGLPGRRIQRLHHPDAGNRRRGQPRRAQGVRRPVRIRFEERQGSSDRRLCQGQRHDQRILRPDRAQRELRHEALRQGRGPEGLHHGVPEDRHRARKPGKHADRAAGRLHRFGRVQHEQVRRDRTRGIEQAVPQPHRQGPQGRRRNRCRIPGRTRPHRSRGRVPGRRLQPQLPRHEVPGQRRHAAAVPVERPAGARGREGHVHQARRARLPQQRVALPADRTPDRRQRRRAAGDVHQHPHRHARSGRGRRRYQARHVQRAQLLLHHRRQDRLLHEQRLHRPRRQPGHREELRRARRMGQGQHGTPAGEDRQGHQQPRRRRGLAGGDRELCQGRQLRAGSTSRPAKAPGPTCPARRPSPTSTWRT